MVGGLILKEKEHAFIFGQYALHIGWLETFK